MQGELEAKLAFKQVDMLDGDHRLLVRFADDRESQTSGADAMHRAGEPVRRPEPRQHVPNWLRAIHADSMPLGLDLQGGVHSWKVDQSAVTDKQDAAPRRTSGSCSNKKFDGYQSVTRSAQGVWWSRQTEDDRSRAREIGRSLPEFATSDAASTGDGYSLIAKLKPELKEAPEHHPPEPATTLRNRVSSLEMNR